MAQNESSITRPRIGQDHRDGRHPYLDHPDCPDCVYTAAIAIMLGDQIAAIMLRDGRFTQKED